MVGALSCISRNTMAFLALSLIRDAQSVSVVRRGYRASLHSPADTQVKHIHMDYLQILCIRMLSASKNVEVIETQCSSINILVLEMSCDLTVEKLSGYGELCFLILVLKLITHNT